MSGGAVGHGAALAPAMVALGVAVLCWPGAAPRRRAASLLGAPKDGAPWARVARRWRAALAGRAISPMVVVTAAIGAGALVAGVGGGVAAVLIVTTVLRVRRALRHERERAEATHGLAEGLASFAAELRSGAPLAAAAEGAGTDAHPVAARVFGRVSSTARLGGDVPDALRRASADEPAAGEHLDRLAAAWGLADRHGIALAGPVDAVAHDVRARARMAARLRAQLAGPRATATVLAALPVLGVLLGEGIGARPWAVLTGSVLGQALLVIGVALACAGVGWTGRITARVTR